MKKLFIFLLAVLIQSVASSQIQSVSLQASGLTCSVCTRAIYKSLKKLPSVAKVQEDIAHSSYHIQFKDAQKVSLADLKKAVLDAGFSVAWMEVKANFNNVEVANDSALQMDDFTFFFVDIQKQKLNGERKLLILDKDYLLEKDRKKYAGNFESKTAATNGDKIFHVTLPQS
jgi:copper chaperone CopZ